MYIYLSKDANSLANNILQKLQDWLNPVLSSAQGDEQKNGTRKGKVIVRGRVMEGFWFNRLLCRAHNLIGEPDQ